LLNFQNNYVERLSINDNAAKSFNILAINLSVLHNYSDSPNKIIFLNLYLAKILDIAAKPFFLFVQNKK